MRHTAVLLTAFVAALSGCQQVPKNASAVPRCSSQYIQSQSDAKALRSIALECIEVSDAYEEAMVRLNKLPLPLPPVLRLKVHSPSAKVELVEYGADVFFNPLESYPSEFAFPKLEQMLAKLNDTFEITSIEVIGRANEREGGNGDFDIAQQRAQVIADYFKEAGLSPAVHVSIKTAPPRHPNTAEGRARDRSVEVFILARRDKVSEKK